MARGKKNGDERLIALLAGGKSVQASAQLAETSERTIRRRMADPTFRQRLNQARAEVLDRALAHLAMGSSEASITLRRLLRKGGEKTRLLAAKAILEIGTKVRESVEMEQRIADLERRLKERGPPR